MPSIQIPQQQNQIKWNKKYITLPKIGNIKWTKHRPLAGKLISTTTKYEAGHWYIIVLCETNKTDRPVGDDVVGIDLGLKDWIITSDGEIFNLHPGLLEKEKKKKKNNAVCQKNKKEITEQNKEKN